MVDQPGICRVCKEPVELNWLESFSGETKKTICKFCKPFEPQRRAELSKNIADGKKFKGK